MRFLYLSALLCVARLAADPAALQAPDFRGAVWGMNQEQVRATEGAAPAEIRRVDRQIVMRYDAPVSPEAPRRVIYIFLNDKLIRAKYIFDRTHEDPNDFIADFHAAEPELREQYGKPATERAIWESDALQLERLPYLDQDRALASDILPSDQNAGLSVSLGYLRLFSQWMTPRTKIVHALSGENSRITHQIEYQSIQADQNTAGLR